VAGALLSIYDMAKSIDRGMSIEAVRLESKAGGRSGEWIRAVSPASADPGTR
jgi:cyclic pyranopterin phosphate synthase